MSHAIGIFFTFARTNTETLILFRLTHSFRFTQLHQHCWFASETIYRIRFLCVICYTMWMRVIANSKSHDIFAISVWYRFISVSLTSANTQMFFFFWLSIIICAKRWPRGQTRQKYTKWIHDKVVVIIHAENFQRTSYMPWRQPTGSNVLCEFMMVCVQHTINSPMIPIIR